MAGNDPVPLGMEPVLDPARVRCVLLPTRVPQSLADPLAQYLEALPQHAQHLEIAPAVLEPSAESPERHTPEPSRHPPTAAIAASAVATVAFGVAAEPLLRPAERASKRS